MNKPKNTRVENLLSEFKKTRIKCLQLAEQLKIDLKKDTFYPNTQRTTNMKCQLLDLQGLVQLKNSLVKVLGELFDLERQYVYQIQKRQTQERIRVENKSSEQKQSSRRSPVRQTKEIVSSSMASSRASQVRSSRKVQVPFYRIDQQTVQEVQTKLDRISKFIASLKKSIKGAAQTTGCKFRTKDYLLEQDSYIKVKAELEKYLMREEQLQKVLADALRQQVQSYFTSNATLSSDGQFYLVKLPKAKPFSKKISNHQSVTRQIVSPAKPTETVDLKLSTPVTPLAHIEAQVEADFQSIKVQLQKKNQNYTELFSKMNEAVEKGNQRLSQIRQKRKQAFKRDDQLWDLL